MVRPPAPRADVGQDAAGSARRPASPRRRARRPGCGPSSSRAVGALPRLRGRPEEHRAQEPARTLDAGEPRGLQAGEPSDDLTWARSSMPNGPSASSTRPPDWLIDDLIWRAHRRPTGRRCAGRRRAGPARRRRAGRTSAATTCPVFSSTCTWTSMPARRRHAQSAEVQTLDVGRRIHLGLVPRSVRTLVRTPAHPSERPGALSDRYRTRVPAGRPEPALAAVRAGQLGDLDAGVPCSTRWTTSWAMRSPRLIANARRPGRG